MANAEHNLESGGGETGEPLRFTLLGDVFGVAVGERPIDTSRAAVRDKKPWALIKWLALAQGHQLSREEIRGRLWPDSRETSDPLSGAETRARQLLIPPGTPSVDPSRVLVVRGPLLSLPRTGPFWDGIVTDVETFEDAAVAARRAATDPEAYERALAYYTGELLPLDRNEEWTLARRDALQRTERDLRIELARLYEERGEYQAGIAALQPVVDAEPVEEGALRGLMRLHALAGNPGRALHQYERTGRDLRREFDTELSEETQRLAEEIRARRYPPPVSPAGAPGTTVAQTSPTSLPPTAAPGVARTANAGGGAAGLLRWQYLVLVPLVVIVLGVALLAAVRAVTGSGVRCSGVACNGQDARQMGCDRTARTIETAEVRDGQGRLLGTVQLKRSDACLTSWSRVETADQATHRLEVFLRDEAGGQLLDTRFENPGIELYGDMWYVGRGETRVKACGSIKTGEEFCTALR